MSTHSPSFILHYTGCGCQHITNTSSANRTIVPCDRYLRSNPPNGGDGYCDDVVVDHDKPPTKQLTGREDRICEKCLEKLRAAVRRVVKDTEMIE